MDKAGAADIGGLEKRADAGRWPEQNRAPSLRTLGWIRSRDQGKWLGWDAPGPGSSR